MKKGKVVILFLSVFLLSVVSFFNGSQAEADTVDITPNVTIKNRQTKVIVGQTGKFDGKIDDIHGVAVKGTIEYKSSDPSIFTVNPKGEWKALRPGKTEFFWMVTLSQESIDQLQAKFPGSVLITREISQGYEIQVNAASQKIFRLYNPNSGEHFYTAHDGEVNNVRQAGWRYEGLGWVAPTSGHDVYRVYNPNAGDHHYTLDLNEKNSLVKVGWRYEGVSWFSDVNKTTPLYRLYNPNAKAGAHHYTTSAYERDVLKKAGWKYEGIAWYGQ